MKTNHLFNALLATGIFLTGLTNAQNYSENILPEANAGNISLNTVPKTVEYKMADNSLPCLSIDNLKNTINLNHKFPAGTYSAVLLVQEFTGRTLKTFNISLYNQNVNEFNISDLLSGTYSYTLLVDNREKVSGEIIVKD